MNNDKSDKLDCAMEWLRENSADCYSADRFFKHQIWSAYGFNKHTSINRLQYANGRITLNQKVTTMQWVSNDGKQFSVRKGELEKKGKLTYI